MVYLTIVNTIAIIYILNRNLFKFRASKNLTFRGKFLGVGFYLNGKRFLYVPVRSSEKTQIKEDIAGLLGRSAQSKRQTLSAKFSWLKTASRVEGFKNHYRVVDPGFVDKLVDEFYEKTKNNLHN